MLEVIHKSPVLEDFEISLDYTFQNYSELSSNVLDENAFNIFDCGVNETLGNSSTSLCSEDSVISILWLAGVSFILSFLILATILGNIFVIAAILIEKNLRTVGNYLVLSLALTDLLVACLVMPLGAVYAINQKWTLGPLLCDLWTSCDVLCCTASILHLLAIATDRYWAVTNVDYIHQRSIRHIAFMIFAVWTVALLISVAPFFGWKDPQFEERVLVHKVCLVSQDLSYQVFATCSSFYLPLILVLALYWRIFKEARKRIRRKPRSSSYCTLQRLPIPRGTTLMNEITTTFTTGSSSNTSPGTTTLLQNGPITQALPLREQNKLTLFSIRKRRKESIDSKRERKAAKILAIITGVFVGCWLPFFIMALMMPMCDDCDPGSFLLSVFLWLGYANSMLNPIIYTIFSPDFRNAFKRMVWKCLR